MEAITQADVWDAALHSRTWERMITHREPGSIARTLFCARMRWRWPIAIIGRAFAMSDLVRCVFHHEFSRITTIRLTTDDYLTF